MNCTLKGLPAGTYYVRAFIDTNGNGVHNPWESWGYANYVGTGSKKPFTPKAAEIKLGSTEVPELTVYIEDMDTDNDGFPDAYEYDQNQSLLTLGPASGATYFTRVNPDLKPSLSATVSLASANLTAAPLMSMLSLDTGVASEATLAAANLLLGDTTGASVQEDINVSIAAFSLADGITLDISTKTVASGSQYVTVSDSATVGVYLVASDSLDFSDSKSVWVKNLVIKANGKESEVVKAAELAPVIEANGLAEKAFIKVKLVK